jgi:nucleoside triphosphate diphosphatase
MNAGDAFMELVRIMERLRAPGGCPWDREQTSQSIKPYVIEEAYEVAEAIEDNDVNELCAELGDLLLQIVFHAQMAGEQGLFTVEDVIRSICEKLIRRHPHVFGDVEVENADEVLRNWSRIKAEERKHKDDQSVLSGVPRALPALLRAHRLGEKASRVGFDWAQSSEVLEKVREELGELTAAVELGDKADVEAELGDLLLALTSLGRHFDIQAEDALQRANDRFIQRFRHIEQRLAAQQRDIHHTSTDDMNELWDEAKTRT